MRLLSICLSPSHTSHFPQRHSIVVFREEMGHRRKEYLREQEELRTTTDDVGHT